MQLPASENATAETARQPARPTYRAVEPSVKAEATEQSSAMATSFAAAPAAGRQSEPSLSQAASASRESMPSGSIASSTPTSPRMSRASSGRASSASATSSAS